MELMAYVDNFLVAFIWFAIVHNIWVILNVWWAINWIFRERRRTVVGEPKCFFVIMLPMLYEQDIAEETISYFLRLEYDPALYKLLVITSARESQEKGATTHDVVQRFQHAECSGKIIHFHTNGSDTTKADQMNQALEWLEEAKPPWWSADVVVGVYDADSRPEFHTLREVDRATRENPNDSAFQQPAVYLSGFERLPSGCRGAYLKSRPIYNLRFCLFREIPGLYRSMIATRSKSVIVNAAMSSPNHFLGHGEFIRVRTLLAVGGFPKPSADTSLGTMLSFMGYAVVPLSSFDIGQTPPSIRMLIRQGSTWYSGAALYLDDLVNALTKGAHFSIRHPIMLFKRWLENMIWAAGPILLLATLFWLYITSNFGLLYVALIIPLLHFFSVLQVVYFISEISSDFRAESSLKRTSLMQNIAIIAAYPFMLLGTCLGPISYYYYWLRMLITGIRFSRSKTDRILR